MLKPGLRMLSAGVLLLCPLLALAAPASLDALQAGGARVTALAVDVESGKVLAQLHGDERLVPASLSKLFTAAVALYSLTVM